MTEVTINVPIATRDTLGGAIIGDGLNITPEGLLSSEVTQQILDNTVNQIQSDFNIATSNIVNNTITNLRSSIQLLNNEPEVNPNATVASELQILQESIYDIQSAINQKGVQVTNEVPTSLYGNAVRQITDKQGLQVVYWSSNPPNISMENPITSLITVDFIFNHRQITINPTKRVTLRNSDKTAELSGYMLTSAIINGNILRVTINRLPLGFYRFFLNIPVGFVTDNDNRENNWFETTFFANMAIQDQTAAITINTNAANQVIFLNASNFVYLDGFDFNNSYIDWGNGQRTNFNQLQMTYATTGTYTIRIFGAVIHSMMNANTTATNSNGMIRWTAVDAIVGAETTNRQNAVSGLQGQISGKADAVHTHSIANITNLQSSLDAKANQSDLTALTGRVSTVEGQLTGLEQALQTINSGA